MNTRRVKLPLVPASDAIDSAQSRSLQLLALRCQPGDTNHRGLLHTLAALAQHAVDGCLAPGARTEQLHCLATIQSWGCMPFALKTKALRNQVLEAAQVAETATARAVTQMLTLSPPRRSELWPHTERVLVRHARQASYYACGAVVLILDALDEPRRAIELPAQVAGALAHKAVWSTGIEQLLDQANGQAAFWQDHEQTQHQPAASPHTAHELELQLFHEFIGVAWKAHRDAQFSRVCSFVDWALASPSGLHAEHVR